MDDPEAPDIQRPVPDFPEWIDPELDLILTPSKLKGLTHPVRLRLLELLQNEGPATATILAARTGQSSGVTSYHLRVLAEHGFIEEDHARGNSRDRYWRAPHRSTGFSVRMPDDPGTAENVDATGQYLRTVAHEVHRRILVGIRELTSDPESIGSLPWKLDDWPLQLTLDEAEELGEQVSELANRYRRRAGDTGQRTGSVRAYFQFQLLPDEAPIEPEARS